MISCRRARISRRAIRPARCTTLLFQSEAGLLRAAPAAHAHLTGADPDHAGERSRRSTSSFPAAPIAAIPIRPTPDVPPGRGTRHRQGLRISVTSNGSWRVLCKAFFEVDQVKMRFRPSFFPFTASPRSRSTSNASARKARCASAKATTGWRFSAAAWCIPTCCAIAASIPTSTRASPGHGDRPHRHARNTACPTRAFFEADMRWLVALRFPPARLPDAGRGFGDVNGGDGRRVATIQSVESIDVRRGDPWVAARGSKTTSRS